ncbi:hypothetical protein CUMW_033910 [Citrus unshiu]|nr:hypothetical protein CUMW_033910 [Citrus unshiu]
MWDANIPREDEMRLMFEKEFHRMHARAWKGLRDRRYTNNGRFETPTLGSGNCHWTLDSWRN